MESITALVACGLAFALSFYIGRSVAGTTRVAAMMGAFCGVAFAILFFVMTVSVGALLPGLFDGWTLGVHFIVLLLAMPLGSAAVAALEFRYLERVEARRLPF